MSFVAPKWDATQSHYVIEVLREFGELSRVPLGKDSSGVPEFSDTDRVHNITDDTIRRLIKEGAANNWFSRLPSHEQLMKRVRHSFNGPPKDDNNSLLLHTLLLTPKQVTFLWSPTTHTETTAPPLYFDESDESDASDGQTEPDITESNLPPVALTYDVQESREEYLLTRLRAAKARVEAEQIRMQYFEATGRMPPDSDSEDD
jgi:hypothetical protein